MQDVFRFRMTESQASSVQDEPRCRVLVEGLAPACMGAEITHAFDWETLPAPDLYVSGEKISATGLSWGCEWTTDAVRSLGAGSSWGSRRFLEGIYSRFKALRTALIEASSMLVSTPAPQRLRPSAVFSRM